MPPPAPTQAPPRPPPPPVTAPHGSEIVALATTVDGGAVASADRLGGIRLWTTLDGTREPVVIRGTAARQVALWRDGDGFALATLDAAGGVQVIRTTAAGAVRGRATAPGGAQEVASTLEGLLILRSDQTLELVDAGGVLRSRLVPEPGSRIESLLVRAGRILALVREDKQLHGRWVVVHHGARWGDDTPKLPFPIARAVLSPDGTRLAGIRPRRTHPVLIDLTKGIADKNPLCVSRAWPHEDGDDHSDDSELRRGDNAPVPLGFLSNEVIACSVASQLIWWGTGGEQHPSSTGSFPIAHQPIAITDRAVIVGTGSSLALANPELNQFLGYGVHDLAGLRTTAAAVVVSGADQRGILLDGGLRERTHYELGKSRGSWLDFVPLDERYGIATTLRRSLDRRRNDFQLAVLDGLAPNVHQLLPFLAPDREFAYSAETRLLATRDGAMALVLRYDPVSHTFGEPVRVGTAISPSKLALLDPRLAGGAVALEIDQVGDGLVVGELRDDELVAGTTVQPRTTYRVPGELRAVDRAGHLYVHRTSDHDDVVVYARDLAVARLPQVAAMTLRPSPDGARIAAFDGPRLVLLTAAGETRWESAQWSSSAVEWSPAGELLVQFPSGVARIDLDSGALADRHCGWSFGLLEQAPPSRDSGPSICEAERQGPG